MHNKLEMWPTSTQVCVPKWCCWLIPHQKPAVDLVRGLAVNQNVDFIRPVALSLTGLLRWLHFTECLLRHNVFETLHNILSASTAHRKHELDMPYSNVPPDEHAWNTPSRSMQKRPPVHLSCRAAFHEKMDTGICCIGLIWNLSLSNSPLWVRTCACSRTQIRVVLLTCTNHSMPLSAQWKLDSLLQIPN